VAEGAVARLDAGRANGRIFTLMAGCGFDADVVHRMHKGRVGRRISQWSYVGPILEAIRSYEYPLLHVDCQLGSESAATNESATLKLSARWAFVVNLPYYAGGLRLSPRAVGDDGLLDVSTFGNGSLWHGLRYVAYVLLRRHHWLADYKNTRVRRVRIESHANVPYQLDGDPGGFLPLEIEVLEERLSVVAPAKRLRELDLLSAAEHARDAAVAQEERHA
jgi:diacylglycerol kinase (ATP)